MEVYTIGYEGIDADRFIKCLKYWNISTLVDIRRISVSRKRHFSKNSLSSLLAGYGIQYINLSILGTPKELGEMLKKTGDYTSFFASYRRYLMKHLEGVQNILDLIHSQQNVALFCFEKDHTKCHRKVVAEEIVRMDGNGMTIFPIRY